MRDSAESMQRSTYMAEKTKVYHGIVCKDLLHGRVNSKRGKAKQSNLCSCRLKKRIHIAMLTVTSKSYTHS